MILDLAICNHAQITPWESPSQLLVLSAVCRLWRSIILESGKLSDEKSQRLSMLPPGSQGSTSIPLALGRPNGFYRSRCAYLQPIGDSRRKLHVIIEVLGLNDHHSLRKYTRVCHLVQKLTVVSVNGLEVCVRWLNRQISGLSHTNLRTLIITSTGAGTGGAHSGIRIPTVEKLTFPDDVQITTVYLDYSILNNLVHFGSMRHISNVMINCCPLHNPNDYCRFQQAFDESAVEYLDIRLLHPMGNILQLPPIGLAIKMPRLQYLAVLDVPCRCVLLFLRTFRSFSLRKLHLSIISSLRDGLPPCSYAPYDITSETDLPLSSPSSFGEIDSLAYIEMLELHICHRNGIWPPSCRNDLPRAKAVHIVRQLAEYLPAVRDLQWEAGTHCAAELFRSIPDIWKNLDSLWLWECVPKDDYSVRKDGTPKRQQIDDNSPEPVAPNEYGGWTSLRLNVCTAAQVSALQSIRHEHGFPLKAVYIEAAMWREGTAVLPFQLFRPVTTARPSFIHRGVPEDYLYRPASSFWPQTSTVDRCPAPWTIEPTKWVAVGWREK